MTSRTPNLFLVGAPRCGTNTLYTYLRGHPQVFMSPLKEPHFFTDHLFLSARPTLRGDEAAYRALFAAAGPARWLGEASPSYLYDPAAPTAIAAFTEDPRCIVTLRHPVDLMRSMYWLRSADALHRGGAAPAAFEAALIDETDASPAPPRAPLSYRAVATLAAHLERYLATFGRRRVHVVVLEDLAARPAETLAALCAFLGIDAGRRLPGRVAASAWTRSRTLARWLWRPPEALRRVLHAGLPPAARRWVRRTARRLNRRAGPRLDPALRARLTREFASEIHHLESLLQRDLSHWHA